jgi:sec-independent protein translocase protein TatB
MFGLSFGEILIILVVALLVLGPTGMPKLARTLGKGLRDFRRATGDLRGAFEQEFYKLDQEVEKVAAADTQVHPAAGLETLHTAPPAPPEGVEPALASAPARAPALAPPDGAVARTAAPQAPTSATPAPAAEPRATTGTDETA